MVKHGGQSGLKEHGGVLGTSGRTLELCDFQADSLQIALLGLHKELLFYRSSLGTETQ